MTCTDAKLLPDPSELPDDPAFLKALIVQLYGTLQDRDGRIRQLEQQMHLLVKRFLHPASEKIDPRQLALFAEAQTTDESSAAAEQPQDEAQEPAPKKPPRRAPNGRGRAPDQLERETVVHDLTPEQKAALGGEQNLVYLGKDVTSQYEWRPSCLLVIEHHQKKYVRRTTDEGLANPSASPGEATGATSSFTDDLAAAVARLPAGVAACFTSPIIVAAKPAAPIPGGAAAPGLLAQVIVSKYGDHLPLYRLERIFGRQGVHFARQTLCDWCAACAKLLTPLANLIRDEVLRSFVIHTDDTPVKVRDAHAKEKFQARFWIYLGDELHRLTWFEFTNTRKRAGPDRVLAAYRGYLQADGYGGYDDYEGLEIGDDSPILKVACWSHARRKFHDALRTEPVAAQIALARIGQLYKLEKELKQRIAKEWRELPIEMRAALIAAERQAHARPILDELKKWLEGRLVEALPKSPLAIAVRYTLNQWDALCRYVEDGRLSIDNNLAERGLRGIAIGRKNWMFVGSETGGRTAAVLFTMIASAIRNQLDPWAYLRDVLTRLPALGERPSREQLLPLLPNRWQPASAQPAAAPRS